MPLALGRTCGQRLRDTRGRKHFGSSWSLCSGARLIEGEETRCHLSWMSLSPGLFCLQEHLAWPRRLELASMGSTGTAVLLSSGEKEWSQRSQSKELPSAKMQRG